MSNHFIEKIDDALHPECFAPLTVTQLMPTFGAKIEGIDLTSDLSDEVRAQLKRAWLTYGVVVFTGQNAFTSEQHLDVAGIFGTPDLGSPFVEKLTAQVDRITTDAARPPVTNLWHSDNTALENPSLGTLVQIQECPTVGGNTGWSSTAKAYRCLSEHMKAYLEDLTAVHYWDGHGHREPGYLSEWNEEKYVKRVIAHQPRHWPIVRVHPLTGEKSLYVNELYTTYIEGLHRYESDAILQFLYSWIRMPEFYLTHNWAPNDVVVWDNFSMQHYGLADYTDFRVNQRVTFVDHPADAS
ncbi:MAG: taurine catabolism dioxygenase TauD [Gordonia sp.]|nr:taurine catabolism dioxygenase TauD [Gordonia sp. (in: high G+C Gram-positive bacteria)]